MAFKIEPSSIYRSIYTSPISISYVNGYLCTKILDLAMD